MDTFTVLGDQFIFEENTDCYEVNILAASKEIAVAHIPKGVFNKALGGDFREVIAVNEIITALRRV
jgi:hypothetical protein